MLNLLSFETDKEFLNNTISMWSGLNPRSVLPPDLISIWD